VTLDEGISKDYSILILMYVSRTFTLLDLEL
jgi:hypothetical protein